MNCLTRNKLFLLLLAVPLLCCSAMAREVARTTGLSQDMYEKMQEIQSQIESGELDKARRRLRALQEKKLTDYELAQTWFLMGYVHYRREDYGAAIGAYKKVLDSDNLPLGLQQNVNRTLAQLSMVRGNFEDALVYLDRLIKISKEPQPDQYALKAQVLYQLERLDESMAALERALALQRKRGEPPRENWLQIKNAILYQRNDYRGMLQVFQQLVTLYPRDRYLVSMAAIYGELGDSKKQLSLLEPLYERGGLDNPSHLVNLASLYMLHEIPYKAATLLDAEIKAERIKANERHLEMLSQAWLLAADYDKALGPMSRAAQQSPDGNLYVNLGRTYMNLNNWQQAEQALEKAFRKGKLRDESGARLMMGMVQFNQKRYREARRSFAEAGQDPKTERLAAQWLQYLEREEEKQKLLEETAVPPPAPG